MTVDLKKLRRVTTRATQPGPWTVDKQGDDFAVLDDNGFWVCNVGRDPINSKFIAAASPDVVLALLDHIDALTKKLRKASR